MPAKLNPDELQFWPSVLAIGMIKAGLVWIAVFISQLRSIFTGPKGVWHDFLATVSKEGT